MLYNTLLISLLKEEAQFFCFVGLLPEEQKASKTVTKNSMQKWANTIPMQLHCTAAAKATPCPVWNEEVELYALTFSGSSLPNYLLFVPSSSLFSPPAPLSPHLSSLFSTHISILTLSLCSLSSVWLMTSQSSCWLLSCGM